MATITANGKTVTYKNASGTQLGSFSTQDTTYGLASTSANGLLRQLNGSTANYMRGDGTWQTPPNTWRGIQNVLTSTSTSDSLSAYQGKVLNDKIGMVWKGNVNLSDMRLSAIGTWIKNHYQASMWISARINANSGATSGYFGTSSLGVLALLSSANYGWAIVMSDHSNTIVFGILQGGAWTWRHPSYSNVS